MNIKLHSKLNSLNSYLIHTEWRAIGGYFACILCLLCSNNSRGEGKRRRIRANLRIIWSRCRFCIVCDSNMSVMPNKINNQHRMQGEKTNFSALRIGRNFENSAKLFAAAEVWWEIIPKDSDYYHKKWTFIAADLHLT